MPIITVDGPRIEDGHVKRELVQALTEAAEKAFGMPRQAIVVLLKENRPDNVAVGGELVSDRQTLENEPE
jgi:4-oxalocrotonate tautomerase